ncbi:MAG: transposase [Cyanobacteria bacterium J06597_16]
MANLGNSDYAEQTNLLAKALSILSAYKVVVLGDREFCSVDLARWLGEQGRYFCFRQKKSTWMQVEEALCFSMASYKLQTSQIQPTPA